MRPLSITAAIVIAAIALLNFPAGKRAPAVQPPAEPQLARSATQETCTQAAGQPQDAAGARGVAEISWFQGTLEEAFARHTHGRSDHARAALFHY